MIEVTVNIAKAKKHFSELLGQVAFGKKHILILSELVKKRPNPQVLSQLRSIEIE